jgi:uncharacterized protein YneF (UPF0154 family)
MEVMDNNNFSDKETLIGNVQETRTMSVSNDPMLMSMLSTGFYTNPLRTTIQEIMFNAWDAHKVSNRQDIPIDIHIDCNSGLTIRDYGIGISDENMDSIYCVYGKSTKRKDKNQTGGFGLGCKSPFSYTESFTVTSRNNGIKSVYLISKTPDNNEGKPGLTTLIKTSTKESGLTVNIPIKNSDKDKVYTYVNYVLYLSGITANVHFNGETKNVKHKTLEPNKVLIKHNKGLTTKNILAVYGGVKYPIPISDEYSKEYNTLLSLLDYCDLFIGFAPNTLTPLPNREGLSMSVQTKKIISSTIKKYTKELHSVFKSLIDTYTNELFTDFIKNDVEPHFAIYYALNTNNITNYSIRNIPAIKPSNIDDSVWNIAMYTIKHKVTSMIDFVSHDYLEKSIADAFNKYYPEHKKVMRILLSKKSIRGVEYLLYSYRFYVKPHIQTLTEYMYPILQNKLRKFESEIRKEFKDERYVEPKLFNNYAGTFKKITTIKHNRYDFDQHKTCNGNEYSLLKCNTIVLAKSIRSLNTLTSKELKQYNTTSNMDINLPDAGILIGYVIHNKKGQYDKALTILKSLGFNVIEALEHVTIRKYNHPKTKKEIKKYNRVVLDGSYLTVSHKECPVTNPTHFISLNTKNNNYLRKVAKKVISEAIRLNPEIVATCNKQQEIMLMKKGVKPFNTIINEMYENIDKNTYRLRKIVRMLKLKNNNILPDDFLKSNIIQKVLGISETKIKDEKIFWDDIDLINFIGTNRSFNLTELRLKVEKELQQCWYSDPMKSKIIKNINTCSIFSKIIMTEKLRNSNKKESEILINNVAKYIRNS